MKREDLKIFTLLSIPHTLTRPLVKKDSLNLT